MNLYCVYLRRHGLNPDKDLVLVKEGFSWPAFFLSFLWALWHRLWLAAAVFLGIQAVVSVFIVMYRPDPFTQSVVSLGLAVLFGFIANDFRQSKLAEEGFVCTDVVSGGDGDQALCRFLDKEPALAQDLNT